MIDLERALTDLAEHLDYPSVERGAAELRIRLAAPIADVHRRRRLHALLATAAVVALASIAVVAIAPARHAVADWLGIGAVEVRRSDRLPRPAAPTDRTVPGAVGSGPSGEPGMDLDHARNVVQFRIATPPAASAGALTRVQLDIRPPGGLVVLVYPRFTLVEVATSRMQGPALAKLVGGGTAVEPVTVNDQPGFWLGAPHEIAYIDRSGNYRKDTVRRSGPVLVWALDGVTYRIEGLRTKAAAYAVAVQVR